MTPEWSRTRDRWGWVHAWLAQPASELGHGPRLVLWTLLSFMDARGQCWPSARAIGERAALSERTVRDHLHALERAGWLRSERRGRGFRYHAETPEDSSGVPADTPEDSSGVGDVDSAWADGVKGEETSGVTPATPEVCGADPGGFFRCKEHVQEPSKAAAADGRPSADELARAVGLREAERRRLVDLGRAPKVESWSAWRAAVAGSMTAAEVSEVLEADREERAGRAAALERSAREAAEREEQRRAALADAGPSLQALAEERGGMFARRARSEASGRIEAEEVS